MLWISVKQEDQTQDTPSVFTFTGMSWIQYPFSFFCFYQKKIAVHNKVFNDSAVTMIHYGFQLASDLVQQGTSSKK